MADIKDPDARQDTSVVWNDDGMQTSFANVVNVQGTREQIEFFFGTNRTWNAGATGPVHVDLTNRMIMTPYATKRLHQILTGVLRKYESRHGVLKVDDK